MLICSLIIVLIVCSFFAYRAGVRYRNMRREEAFGSGMSWGFICGTLFGCIICAIFFSEHIASFW